MIINVARKELKSLFASPMGWIILALLMLAFGSFYLQGINKCTIMWHFDFICFKLGLL